MLLGEFGCSAVYGPQKLSDEWIKINANGTDIQNYRIDSLEQMEANMKHMNIIWTRDLGINVNLKKGSGAAGGLVAALMIYLGATSMESGFKIVAKYVGFDVALKCTDLVITGEGAIDSQTANEKVPDGVAKHAYLHGIESVVCIAGKVEHENMKSRIKQRANIIPFAMATGPMSLEYSMKNAFDLLTESVYRIVELFLFAKTQKSKL